MELFDLFFAFFVFCFGFFVSVNFGSTLGSTRSRGTAIYLWHFIFCLFYLQYSIIYGADAVSYFQLGIEASSPKFSFGTEFIVWLVWILSTFKISYASGFLLFNVAGTIGLLAFDASLRELVVNKGKWIRRLAATVVFLPSVSFWSAAIGKDAISFMATGLALWAALQPNKRYGLMAFSIVAMLVVRPHIAGIMLLALATSLALQRKMHLGKRIILLLISSIAVGALVPFALSYAGLQDANNANDVEAYVQQRQGYNQEGGGGIDISSMSLPMQMATYVFRPMPFEANSITTAAAALDNIVILVVFVMGLNAWRKRSRRKTVDDGVNTTFLWLYSLVTWVILSMTTANLGIAVRQKWMFVPILIFLLLRMTPDKKQRHLHLAAVSSPAWAPTSRSPQTWT